MKTGIELITDERRRQIEEEGWTSQHDDQHTKSQMMYAAVCYIMASAGNIVETYWPWGRQWWKPTERLRDLVKAGALIAAEIDRLQRVLPQEESK